MIPDVHDPQHRPRPLHPGSRVRRKRLCSDNGIWRLDLGMQGLHTLSGSDAESRAMSRRGLTATSEETDMSAYMLLQTNRMRLPQTHPCQREPWIEVPVLWYCGRRRSGWPRAPVLAIGLRSSGIKKECPEIDGRASCRLGILVLPAGWLVAPQSASPPESVCGRSVAVSPSLGAARCQAGGERKRAAAAAGHPQVPAPMYAKAPMIAMPMPMPCWTMPSMVVAASI